MNAFPVLDHPAYSCLLYTSYPYTQAGKLQSIRKYGQLLSEEYTEEGIKVTAYVPAELFAGLYTDIPEK